MVAIDDALTSWMADDEVRLPLLGYQVAFHFAAFLSTANEHPMPKLSQVFSVAVGLALIVPTLFFTTTAEGQGSASAGQAHLAINGYCSVCITKMQKWEKGSPKFASLYDGKTYQFPNAAIKGAFDASPVTFAPALNGDCVVCYEKMGKRMPGSVKHTSLYKNRLYLFPSDKELQMFLANPAAFAKTDLALGGECAVCLAKMGKHVPGSAEFTVIHDGMRYQFPSAKEADMFRQSPVEIVKAVSLINKTGEKSSMSKAVRLVGTSGCAGCEHGLKTLASPDELGLAIETDEGKIVVVEDAHTLFPAHYKNRFDGGRLVVEGHVLKTDGDISWIKPTKLAVVNR